MTHDATDKLLRENLSDNTAKSIPRALSQFLASRLGRIQDMGVRNYIIDPDVSGGYDHMWQINYSYRMLKKTKKPIYFFILVNKDNEQIKAIGVSKSHDFDFSKDPDKVYKLLEDNRKTPFKIIKLDENNNGSLYNKFSMNSLDDIENIISKTIELSLYSLAREINTFLSNGAVNPYDRDNYSTDNIINDYRTVMEQEKSKLLTMLDQVYKNEPVYVWGQDTIENLRGDHDYDHHTIYNHITMADNKRSQEYRYSALKQFVPLGTLYLDKDDVWNAIDQGSSPIKTLAEHLNVKPSTLKNMIKKEDIYCFGKQTNQYAIWLDNYDPSYWPKTKDQAFFFMCYMESADGINELCGIDQTHFTKENIRRFKNDTKEANTINWHKLNFYSFREYTCSLLKAISKTPAIIINRNLRNKIESIDLNISPEKLSDIPCELRDGRSFWEDVRYKLFLDLRNFQDMKRDVEKKILVPAIILSMERAGYKFAEQSLIDGIIEDLSPKLWGRLSLPEFKSRNDYWHSPRVNIGRKFQALTIEGSDFDEWHNIVDEPIKLNNDITAYPLSSTDELREEADHMGHCVWSYSSECLNDNQHIFSLRDGKGNRLSTLSLKDQFNSCNKKELIVKQNKSIRNRSPSSKAKAAADQIIDMFNKNTILPNWQKIDDIRSAYKVENLNNKAGYDFKDQETMSKVFSIYKPCLPRSIRKDIRQFTDKLDIDNYINNLIDNHDFSLGGLVTIKPAKQAIITNQKVSL